MECSFVWGLERFPFSQPHLTPRQPAVPAPGTSTIDALASPVMDVLSDLLHRARARHTRVHQLIQRPPWSMAFAEPPALTVVAVLAAPPPSACWSTRPPGRCRWRPGTSPWSAAAPGGTCWRTGRAPRRRC
ncbi:cupin domain-containing protein [Kitasatospora cineracea]